jgi:guanylate kinase
LWNLVWLSDQLLEHALVYGEYKGIPRQQVDAALGKGSDVVLRIDVQVGSAAVFGCWQLCWNLGAGGNGV